MKIKNIQIKNFRNYDEEKIDFNPHINIFIGKNAQGKTNILESIYVLAITKSHRTFIDSNMIKNGSKFLKVKGSIVVEKEKDKKNLEVVVSSKGKKVSIGKKVIKRISDYISTFNVVVFCPDDLEIIKGSPGTRRKFLNIEIGQLNNKYVTQLNNYTKILKNRNEYLKKISVDNVDRAYLSILNNQLAVAAAEIFFERKKFIEDISSNTGKIYYEIVKKNGIEIKYETTIPLNYSNKGEVISFLLEKYNKNLVKEIMLKQTIIGPHRDDFKIIIGKKEIKDYGSQGQQRIAVLCLKLSEIKVFKEITKEYPVLLLDDIFSELDIIKRARIIKYLKRKMQIFITTTELDTIDKKLFDNATIFKVNNAKITRKRRGEVND